MRYAAHRGSVNLNVLTVIDVQVVTILDSFKFKLVSSSCVRSLKYAIDEGS